MWLAPKLRNLMRNRVKSREIHSNDIVHEENFNPIWNGKLEFFNILEYEYFTTNPRQDNCERGFCLTFVLWSPQLCQRLFPRMRLLEYVHIEGNNIYFIKCQWKQSVADMKFCFSRWTLHSFANVLFQNWVYFLWPHDHPH